MIIFLVKMNCLENLKICKAACCRGFAFDLEIKFQDKLNYYKYHGCKIERIKRNIYRIFVPLKCQMLDENNLCKLHGTDKKPTICRKNTVDNPIGIIPDTCLMKKQGGKNEFKFKR